MKISELQKDSYVYRYKPIVFNSGTVPPTEQRKDQNIDQWDMIFSSKEEYNTWYKGLVAGFAELDHCLNYCKHFIRTKGNDGNYVREGKSFPVNGTWCGTQDYGRGESGAFFAWVNNNFGEDWYELMDRYRQ
jgi:hypothetical protein